jgi:hypothetical protein
VTQWQEDRDVEFDRARRAEGALDLSEILVRIVAAARSLPIDTSIRRSGS